MENPDEKEKQRKYKKIARESMELQQRIDKDEISREAVQHRAAQIAYERGGTHARAAMNKIIENPNDLTKLKEYLDSIGVSPSEKFSHSLLMKISRNLNLTINEACELGDLPKFKNNAIVPI